MLVVRLPQTVPAAASLGSWSRSPWLNAEIEELRLKIKSDDRLPLSNACASLRHPCANPRWRRQPADSEAVITSCAAFCKFQNKTFRRAGNPLLPAAPPVQNPICQRTLLRAILNDRGPRRNGDLYGFCEFNDIYDFQDCRGRARTKRKIFDRT